MTRAKARQLEALVEDERKPMQKRAAALASLLVAHEGCKAATAAFGRLREKMEADSDSGLLQVAAEALWRP